jgi:hypothetical protein
MKKTVLSLLVITGLILAIFSCNKTSPQEAPLLTENDKTIITQFSQIGQIHNDGLNEILESLKSKYGNKYIGGNSVEEHDNLFQLIDKSNQRFVESTIQPKNINIAELIENNKPFDNLIKANFGKDLSTQMRFKTNAISIAQKSTIARSVTQELSENFYAAINELNKLVDNDAEKSEYDKLLEAKIGGLQTDEEKMKFASAVSIAHSTMQYWKENYNEWKAFFQETKQTSSSTVARAAAAEDGGKKVGKADIAGIITGGVGGCAYGAIGGTVVVPGVGTLAGCAALGSAGAITGGLGNSAKAAVESLIDWLTS